MYTVDITGESRFPVDRKRVRSVVSRVLRAYAVQDSVVVGVRIVGDRKMAELNRDWRTIEGTTDVLSFPTEDASAGVKIDNPSTELPPKRRAGRTGPSAGLRIDNLSGYAGGKTKGGIGGGFTYPKDEAFPLGDIVISYPKARMQAAERDILVDDEIEALVEHGVKSLLGDHE